MRLQGKRERIGSAQGCGHRLSGTIQGRSNPDVHPQGRQARTDLQDGGRGSCREWGMSSTWTCGTRTGTKGKKKTTKGRNMYAACWCLSRKGTTDRRAYPDLRMYECSQGKSVMLSSATHGIPWDKGETGEGRWDKGYTSCYCLWVPKFTWKNPNPQGVFKIGNWGRHSVTMPLKLVPLQKRPQGTPLLLLLWSPWPAASVNWASSRLVVDSVS